MENSERDLSHMTMRISLNKLQFDIIKSGLQKSIRRCMTSEALSYGIEGDLFSLVENQGKSKGNRTNLMNRLRIILIEDLFDWRVILQVEPWFTAWEKERKNISSRKYLLSIIRVMSEAKKIRLISDLKVFLIRELYRQTLGNKYDKLFNGWNEHGERTDLLSRFIYLLKNKNPNCLYWYQEMYLNKLDTDIWLTLINIVKNSNPILIKVIKTLQLLQLQLTKNHRERYLYTMCAIAFILFDDHIDWSPKELSKLMSDQKTEKIYQKHLHKWTCDNLPYGKAGWLPENIVVDKHTFNGRMHGKTALDFAKIGSLVLNEDKNFYFPILRKIYLEKKIIESDSSYKSLSILPLNKMHKINQWKYKYLIDKVELPQINSQHQPEEEQDNKTEHSKLFINHITIDDLNADENGLIYGQKVTASWKPKTYITRQWVYKGPYMDKRKSIPNHTVERYNKFKLYGDEAAISLEVVKGPDNQIYLKSPNIGEKWSPITTVDNVTHDIVGRIVDRASIGVYTGRDLIDLQKMDWKRCIYHFIIRYIINAGDSIYNNYINNYGIDYEEDRTPDKEEPTNIVQIMFKKPLSKKYMDKTKQAIKQNIKFLKNKIETIVLPKVQGEELKRTQFVLKFLSQKQ
jgi:hypothetical protein